jgi:hypothetical protein
LSIAVELSDKNIENAKEKFVEILVGEIKINYTINCKKHVFQYIIK